MLLLPCGSEGGDQGKSLTFVLALEIHLASHFALLSPSHPLALPHPTHKLHLPRAREDMAMLLI